MSRKDRFPPSAPEPKDTENFQPESWWWKWSITMPAAWWRWMTRKPCEICGDRRRCWRWHVEMFRCPTCGHEVTEFDAEPRDRIVEAMFSAANQYEVKNTSAWNWNPMTGSFEPMRGNGV